MARDETTCPTCRRHRDAPHWCAVCRTGRYGRYVLDDRTDFDALIHDMRILALANEAAERCEHCAAAIVTGTTCPVCRVEYRDGTPLPVDGGD